MTQETLQQLTWTVARAGGVIAYLLLTVSVAVGLVLSLKWRSPRYTRWVTTELHRFVTLLSLVFIAIHGVALAVDPYVHFSLGELLLPVASHYRPVWVALGITAGYLGLAVYLSERIRGRIGYAWWHRFHLLAFVVWGGSLVHGLGAGSDSQAPWVLALYGASLLLVIGLLLLRLRPAATPTPRATPTPPVRATAPIPAAVSTATPRPTRRPRSLRPLWILPVAAAVVAGSAWAVTGPLADDWNARAGGTAAKAADPSPSVTVVPSPSGDPVTPIGLPFDANLEGTVEQVGGSAPAIIVKASFQGDAAGTVEFHIPMSRRDDDQGSEGGAASDAQLTITVQPTGATCAGQLEYADQGQIGGSCTLPSGRRLAVAMRIGLDGTGALVGVMEVSPRA